MVQYCNNLDIIITQTLYNIFDFLLRMKLEGISIKKIYSSTIILLEKNPENHFKLVKVQSFPIMGKIVWHLTSIKKCKMSWGALILLLMGLKTLRKAQ